MDTMKIRSAPFGRKLAATVVAAGVIIGGSALAAAPASAIPQNICKEGGGHLEWWGWPYNSYYCTGGTFHNYPVP
jgi:hypothetical protein